MSDDVEATIAVYTTAALVTISIVVIFWLNVFYPEVTIDVDRPTVTLGDTTYDMERIKAPVVSGLPLRFGTYVATRTWIGVSVRRFLLRDNKVGRLRELAWQMPEQPPLSHPLYRMTRDERDAHDAKAVAAKAGGYDVGSVIPLLISPVVKATFTKQTSRVMNFHDTYKSTNNSVTPTVVAERLLVAIDKLQPKYRMFSYGTVLREEILEAASASTLRYKNNTPLSIFDGVPVAFKDMIEVKGYHLTNGSKYTSIVDKPLPSKEDNIMVARFRNLGAIILPPTTMTEGGVTPIGYSVYPRGPFNPYNHRYQSGGSSGGSAVVVALGVAPVTIGFDGGGSVRTPASWSGVVGIATGFGRFPFSSHYSGTNIKSGILAETVHDAALGYAVLSPSHEGHKFYDNMYDGGYRGCPEPLLNELILSNDNSNNDTHNLQGVTLGVWPEWFNDASDAVVKQNQKVLDMLVERGATIKHIKLPNINSARLSHGMKITSEFASSWDGAFHDTKNHDYLESNTRIMVGSGSVLYALEALSAEKIRSYMLDYVRNVYKDGVDMIVTPTSAVTAELVEDTTRKYGKSDVPMACELLKHVFLGNFIGLSGVANPIGFDASNADMPISMLLHGWQWEEDKVLRVSKTIEEMLWSEKARKKPDDYVDLLE